MHITSAEHGRDWRNLAHRNSDVRRISSPRGGEEERGRRLFKHPNSAFQSTRQWRVYSYSLILQALRRSPVSLSVISKIGAKKLYRLRDNTGTHKLRRGLALTVTSRACHVEIHRTARISYHPFAQALAKHIFWRRFSTRCRRNCVERRSCVYSDFNFAHPPALISPQMPPALLSFTLQ